jgi:hypothetical protein
VYNTSAGSDSIASTSGLSFGQYPEQEGAGNACDNNLFTKYLNFGWCQQYQFNDLCGLNTGLYLTLQRGASLVVGLQICTANDYLKRDPVTVTLEGSNQSGITLTLGASWTLIYNGSSGMYQNPGRCSCGAVQYFDNMIQYISYRFLVTSIRKMFDATQYSEFQLFGY